MPQISFVNLLIVATVAVLAPLLLGYLPRLRLPAVVVEIVAGVVGPSVRGRVQIDLPVQIVGTISSVTGAALICAGLLSVVIFPATALSRLRERRHPGASSTPASQSYASAHSEAMYVWMHVSPPSGRERLVSGRGPGLSSNLLSISGS